MEQELLDEIIKSNDSVSLNYKEKEEVNTLKEKVDDLTHQLKGLLYFQKL